MKKILIVEDEKLIRNNLRFVLEHNGYYCAVAEDGFEGLEKIKQFKPALVLCDLMMPRMNGFELLAEVRKLPDSINVPFVFITARADEKDKREGMNLGADDYITKPFNTNNLLETVQKRIALAEKRNEVQLVTTRTNAFNIFCTISSHEYLTPLNSIINFAEILVAENVGVLPKRSINLLQHIEYSGKKLYRVTRKLFWYITLDEQAQHPWQPRGSDQVNIQQLFLQQFEVIASTGYSAVLNMDKKSIDLFNYKYTDVELMAGELMENAVKFSLPKTTIQVGFATEGGLVCITLDNQYNGPLFTNANITRLEKDNTGENWQGAGLGLYLLQSWAVALGGSLFVTGNGEKFTAKLMLPQTL